MKTETECPVCGNFKHGHMDICQECDRQRTIIRERKQQAKRDKHFGPLWPVD